MARRIMCGEVRLKCPCGGMKIVRVKVGERAA